MSSFARTTPFMDRVLWAARISAFASLGLYFYARQTGRDWLYMREISWSGVPLEWLNYGQLKYVYQEELRQFLQMGDEAHAQAGEIVQRVVNEAK